VLERIRRHLSFANVTSLLALFIALGGTSYGLATGAIGSRELRDNSVRSKDIRNRAVTHRDVKRNGLGGTNIKESRLGKVPRARAADRVGGLTGAQLLLRCPGGTSPVSDVCVETTVRPRESYTGASIACEATDRPATPGRRLPTHAELSTAIGEPGIALAPEGELTQNVYPSESDPSQLQALFVAPGGGVGLTPNTGAGAKPFRCVVDPSN
jgi:hypothetical protein